MTLPGKEIWANAAGMRGHTLSGKHQVVAELVFGLHGRTCRKMGLGSKFGQLA